MVKQTIQVFCRIKPTKEVTGLFGVDTEESQQPIISFTVPKELTDGFINNKKELYKFNFNHVFEQQAKQDEVFDVVAKPVIDNVLSGFNGTIFAYGQTGSGKTFSITGGAERYVDRGIIPRSLSYIFETLSNSGDNVFSLHISYLEIYNESGFDLLNPKHEATKLEDLPKITLLEDNDGNIHLKNLSIHQASNEEEALNLLFLGDTNRMISETPMNQASTRSHCIFTIHIMSREADSPTIRRSKLHLVDLAGSERVGKTGVGGTLLKEAKYINLSLHYLEQVIIALSEKSRNHIPYRNSMMTSVLRDSLGGNCMTTMIATCSVDKKNIDESISTCRFAQRVAMIKNDAILNEELDPKLMIAKLKREIQQLKDELSLATGATYEGELSEEEKERLQSLVSCYIEDADPEALLSVNADMRKINFCFSLLKKHCKNTLKQTPDSKLIDQKAEITKQLLEASESEDSSYLAKKTEVNKLKELIKQRDNEINILVKMLKKEKERADGVTMHQSQPSTQRTFSSTSTDIDAEQKTSDQKREINTSEQFSKLTIKKNINKPVPPPMSIGRKEAFEIFQRDYNDNKLIEENKTGLKMRFKNAKQLGQQVNNSRESINSVKAKLEKLKSLQLNNKGNSTKEEIEHEEQLRKALDAEKMKYKTTFNELKLLKTEIEHIQHLLEKMKVKMQKDFEIWWAEEASKLEQNQMRSNDVKSAWKTPPLTPIKSETPLLFYPVNESRKSSGMNSFDMPISSLQSTPERNKNSSQRTQGRESFLSTTRPGSSIKLTGDEKTDEDILAFMKAREELMKKAKR